MADTFGAISVPITDATPLGDPALELIGDYVRTLLNAKAGSAFVDDGQLGEELVRAVIVANPNEYTFDDCNLPALFVHRAGGVIGDTAADLLEDASTIVLTWLLSHRLCEGPDPRRVFFNAFAKLVSKYIKQGRDPLWTAEDDPDPFAATIAADTDSIVLALPTQLTARTISSAGLTGVFGASEFSRRLAPTVTTATVGADTYNTSTSIVLSCIDLFDRTVLKSLRLTKVRGGETLTVPEDVKKVVSISEPAQLSTLGTISYGTDAMAGRGSVLRTVANLAELRFVSHRSPPVRTEEIDGDGRPLKSRIYHALEMTLAAREVEAIDLTDTTRLHPIGLDQDTSIEELVLAQRSLPDA